MQLVLNIEKIEEKHEIMMIIAEVSIALSELGPYELRKISALLIVEHSLQFLEVSELL
jgi:hypothetical protein